MNAIRRTRRTSCVLVVLLVAGATGRASAQASLWKTTLEASANLLFGAAEGRVASGSFGTTRADSALEIRAASSVTYADSRNDAGVREVTARSWTLNGGMDFRPKDRWSPFWFGTFESNFQQRIASRVSAGAGAKLTLMSGGKDDDLSVSLAMLWERTNVLQPDPGTDPSNTLARWSLRFRVRRQLSPNLHFSHVTFYQPAVNTLDRYTTDSNTSLALQVNSSVALTATFQDRYDSQASERGARSNHDGHLLFGVRATF